MNSDQPAPDPTPPQPNPPPTAGRKAMGCLVWGLSGLALILTTAAVGGIGGFAVGYYRMSAARAARPPAPRPTMGMESAGIAELMEYVLVPLLHGAIGLVCGLVLGIVLVALPTIAVGITRILDYRRNRRRV